MTYLAFDNKKEIQQFVIDQLQNIAVSDYWLERPVYWDGIKGSVVGLLLQSDDLSQWEKKTGLPMWVALLLDTITVHAFDRQEAMQEVISLMEELPVGTDISRLGCQSLVLLLRRNINDFKKAETVSMRDDLSELLEGIASLHEKVSRGNTVSAKEWRQAREKIINLTEGEDKNSLSGRIGTCVEAAGWDPLQSRTAVSDTLRTWIDARVALAKSTYSWSKADDDTVRALMNKIHQDALSAAEDNNARINVFGLLEQQYPEWSERMKAMVRYEREQAHAAWKLAMKLLHEAVISLPEASRG